MSLMRLIKLVIPVAMVMLVSACAIAPTSETSYGSETFARSGRFALHVEKSQGGQDAVQGGFQWQESNQQLLLNLVNPMGTVLAQIEVDQAGRSLLRYPSGELVYADSPDLLVEQLFGYAIPVKEMRTWLRGNTGSDPSASVQLEDGQLRYFEQNGWRVRLQRYDTLGPRLLQMNRNQGLDTLSVRLVVDY